MTEIVMAQTPPILHRPSDKERKYDRQLRLWAASGQAALESANILLVNSGSGTVGVETLKNLVLPGIGRFAIYDSAKVQEADLGVNFFLDQSCLGKQRAQCCVDLLLELNPEAEGDWYPKSEMDLNLDKFLESSPTFTMILYSHPISGEAQARLEKYGMDHKTPLFAVHSVGLYSYFRIHLPGAFPIVDTHPDATSTTDLRLLAPWPELVEFARVMTTDIANLDNHDHGHLPYIVILLHYLDQWRETHNGKYPANYKEKIAFRQLVSEGARRDTPEGGEENFDEAVAAVLRNIEKPSMPSGLRDVFQYRRDNPALTSAFWIITDAIQQFYDRHLYLPVPGGVPDMKAQSKVYVQLQNIYKKKAKSDVAEVLSIVQTSPAGADVDPAEVELYCKNAAFVKLINAAEASPGHLAEVVDAELANDENAEAMMMPLSLIPIYLALQATSEVATATAAEILDRVRQIAPTLAENERLKKAAEEVARTGGGELHNISALTGGMVAQEMIKIITKQYIPIDNTCIFDGIGSRCQVVRL